MRTTASTPNLNCQHCNVEFKPKRGSVGKFCSMACNYEHQKADKLNGKYSKYKCCICHALVGLGIRKSAKLIAGTRQSITQRLKFAGVTRSLCLNNKSNSFDAFLRVDNAIVASNKTRKWQDAYMSEYYLQFPDWSTLWKRDIINKRNRIRTVEIQKERETSMHHNDRKESLRIKTVVRGRVYNAITAFLDGKGSRRKTSERMLGCTIEAIKLHIEKQFKNGMDWNNYGRDWHVDHIIPLSSFDLLNPIQYTMATHYTNLQPMSAKENRMKSSRITQTHQLQFL